MSEGSMQGGRVAAAPGVKGRERRDPRPKRGQSDAVHTLLAVVDI